MTSAALALVLFTGLCGEPYADDCGCCSRTPYSFRESFRKFFCDIARPSNAHVNDWPLEYPDNFGPEGYDYRRDFGYPWSNTPCDHCKRGLFNRGCATCGAGALEHAPHPGPAYPPGHVPAPFGVPGGVYHGAQNTPPHSTTGVPCGAPYGQQGMPYSVEQQAPYEIRQGVPYNTTDDVYQGAARQPSPDQTPRMAAPNHLPSVMAKSRVTPILRRPVASIPEAIAPEQLEAARPEAEIRR